jgi:PqqD family protein of HPr-rel-A system
VAAPRYRAADSATCRVVPLDDFTLIYHGPSGLTHLVTAPAPEILAALATPLTRDALLARLAEQFELTDGDGAALDARLAELVAAGLVAAI